MIQKIVGSTAVAVVVCFGLTHPKKYEESMMVIAFRFVLMEVLGSFLNLKWGGSNETSHRYALV